MSKIDHYPEPVKEYLQRLSEGLHDFYVEEEITEHGPEACYEVLGEKAFQNWLNTGDPILSFSEESFGKVLSEICVFAALFGLEKKGLIETEDGFIHITKNGLDVVNALKNKQ